MTVLTALSFLGTTLLSLGSDASKRQRQKTAPEPSHAHWPPAVLGQEGPLARKSSHSALYEMESDTSPEIIYYRAHGSFYLYSLESAKLFANNSLICHLFYLSISGLLTLHISGGANDVTPVTQATPWMGAQGHVGMSDSCPGSWAWTLPLSGGVLGKRKL